MRIPARTALRIGAAVVAVLSHFGAASAQTVSGRVIENGTGRPLAGAFVVLLDDAGTQRDGVLTDSAGSFSITAPGPGSYTLRADFIGHASPQSPPLTLAAGQTLSFLLKADVYAIPLAGLQVRGRQRCERQPRAGETTARLWEEARKALAVAAWVQSRTTLRFRIARYHRILDPVRMRVIDEQRTVRAGYGMASPFRSISAEQLADSGYMRAGPANEYFMYYAPDADVLLSESFVDLHCFHVRTEKPPEPGWIGLAFEAIRRDRPDIRGVLWLDRETAELRTIEFHYVNLPWDVDPAAQGGFIALTRVPTGPWIVSRWWIRMPRMAEQRLTLFGQPSRASFMLTGVEQEGGEVLEVRNSAGQSLLRATPEAGA